MELFKKIQEFFYKNNNDNWVEYIEADDPFNLNIVGQDSYKFTWGRISKPSKNMDDWNFSHGEYQFTSVGILNHDESNGKAYTFPINKKEYERLKKLSKKSKKIIFTNPQVINSAVWGLIILPLIIYADKIVHNIHKIYIYIINPICNFFK